MRIPLFIKKEPKDVRTIALIDSGAGDIFIDEEFAKQQGIHLTRLQSPIAVYNVDGTPNRRGHITHFTWLDLEIAGKVVPTKLYATSLGKEHIILGLRWLKLSNPEIDWKKGTIAFLPLRHIDTIPHYPKASVEDAAEEPEIIPKDANAPWLLGTGETFPTISELHTEPAEPDVPESPPEEAISTLEWAPPMEQWDGEDTLLAYVPGETAIRAFQIGIDPTPDLPNEPTVSKVHIGRTTTWKTSQNRPLYSFGTSTWIRAKTNPAMEMAQKANAALPSRTIEELVPLHYHSQLPVFEKKAAERFPDARPWDHAIDLKPDFVPKNCKVYPLSPKEQAALDTFLEENLRKNYIRPSKSPMASPFFFVAKKDGSLRPCQDYRYLNEGTIKNTYPLPLIGDLVDKLKGATVFSKLDLRSGYNNVRIKEGDQWKAAFKCPKGLFEPTVMFFGLCNSPATFQAMMNEIFKDMIDEGWLVIYMDDMLIFSHDTDTHRKRTLRLLQRLQENDLFLKAEKCVFDTDEVEFLGMIIRPDHVAMDPTKLNGIKDWPVPTTVKGVRSFLGFGNFYRRFISHYSDIARPLNDLTRKDQPWTWTEPQQQAFETLKQKFAESPVLRMPDKAKAFSIESDASKFASGAVLRQQDTNGDWHPCAYLSQSFNAAERNYEIYDRELLGIIRALTEWRHYLEGNPYPVEILSDHKNLTYFRTPQRLNRRQARWGLFLSQFDLQLRHVPGTRMVQSDTLSRLHHLNLEDKDNNDITLLASDMFLNATELEDQGPLTLLDNKLFIRAIDDDLTNRIRHSTAERDPIVSQALLDLKEGKLSPLNGVLSDWSLQDGLIYYKGRCYIPQDIDLRREIVRRHHDSLPMGHPGQFGTKELVSRQFWWPGLSVFVKNFVQGCAVCQQTKINTHPSVPALMPIPGHPNANPFEYISVDFITDLPPSKGFDAIMVVGDHDLTKGEILIPCQKSIDALGTANLLYEHVYRRFGLFSHVISDRGPQFASKVFQEVAKRLGFKSAMSTAYHPQTDGGTERLNQGIEAYLRAYCADHPETWAEHIVEMEFAHNQYQSAERNASPFFLMMGYNPRPIHGSFCLKRPHSIRKTGSVAKRSQRSYGST